MLELKEYQEEASRIVEDKFNSGTDKTTVIWATGLGKTYIPIDLMKKHPDKRFLVLAPRHSILKQTREYMKENKISSENAMFYTYSGLSKMKEEVMEKIEPDYIILDEMHRAGAKEWGKGIDRLWEMYPKVKSLGLTATPTRMDGRDMVKEKFNEDISHEITLEEAIARGLLKMPKGYINGIYSFDEEISDIEKSIQKIQDNEERNKLTQKLEQAKRKLKESKGLDEIFAERMSNKQGKYVIFCKDIAHMHEMMEKAEEWFKGVNTKIEKYSISSEKNPLQNSRELKHFKENNSESLKLLYSVDMFNEGLHIENDGIIMLRPTASWIIYLQQFGRTLGIQESGEVFDIVSNSRSSKDIYQFYETVKEIQKRENITDVHIDFTIYDEIRDIRDVLDEINASIHRDKFSFEEKIEYLKALKEQGKDLSEIKQKDKAEDGTPIGTWVSQFRTAYNKGELSKEAREEIEELGIEVERQIAQTLSKKEKIEYLKELKEQGKDLSEIKLSDKTEDGTPIGRWVHQFRTAYNKGELSKEEREEIEELGIELERQIAQTLSTKEKIEYLKELKEQGKDLSEIKRKDEAEDGTPIGVWVNKFRKAYKKGDLSKEEREEIEELGIDLEKQKFSNKEKIEYLKELKEQGKDLSTDKAEDGTPIGTWLNKFKTAYRKGNLTKEEIEEIEKLGIRLERQKAQALSNKEKIEYLKELKEQGKDLSEIKQTDEAEDGTLIGTWVANWRTAYKKGNLSKEEGEEIEKLGIELEKQNLSNKEKIEYLKLLKEQGKDLSKIKQRDKAEDGVRIGTWVMQFRRAYNNGKLGEEEKEEIEELGIKLSLKDKQKDKANAKEKLDKAKNLLEQYEKLLNEKEKSNFEK